MQQFLDGIPVRRRPIADKSDWLEFLGHNSYRSELNKLLYVATPKAACTLHKWWLADLESHFQTLCGMTDSVEIDPSLVIHDRFHKVAPDVTHPGPESLVQKLTSESYLRLAAVRNPYKRIFSGRQSKLLMGNFYQFRVY